MKKLNCWALSTLLLLPGALLAQVECRVLCKGKGACELSPNTVRPVSGGYFKLDNCDSQQFKVATDAILRYIRNSQPVVKHLSANMAIAPAVSDGDKKCPLLGCGFRPKTSKVQGANPMGADKGQLATPEALIQQGLPFEEVIVPAEGLVVQPQGASAGARLVLLDAGARELGQFAVEDGRLTVPATLLTQGTTYRFRWEAGAATEGSFRVARPRTIKRAEDAARAAASEESAPAEEALNLAWAYHDVGLHWNAMRLLEQMERGEK